jgi:hypothetical protein
MEKMHTLHGSKSRTFKDQAGSAMLCLIFD